jgi:type I restriction enzyme M protein
MAKKGSTSAISLSSANLGFEAKSWQAADQLRGHMHPSENKQVVLRLIFLKYIGAII